METAIALVLFAVFAAFYWLALLLPADGRDGLRPREYDFQRPRAQEPTWAVASLDRAPTREIPVVPAPRGAQAETAPTVERLPEAA
jgi:hypothetical protein